MTQDEDFSRYLRERIDAVGPAITVDTTRVVRRARRGRAPTRTAGALALTIVLGGAGWAVDTKPWSSPAITPAGSGSLSVAGKTDVDATAKPTVDPADAGWPDAAFWRTLTSFSSPTSAAEHPAATPEASATPEVSASQPDYHGIKNEWTDACVDLNVYAPYVLPILGKVGGAEAATSDAKCNWFILPSGQSVNVNWENVDQSEIPWRELWPSVEAECTNTVDSDCVEMPGIGEHAVVIRYPTDPTRVTYYAQNESVFVIVGISASRESSDPDADTTMLDRALAGPGAEMLKRIVDARPAAFVGVPPA